MKNQLTVNWTEDELPRFIEEWFGPLTYLKSPERQATPSALFFSVPLKPKTQNQNMDKIVLFLYLFSPFEPFIKNFSHQISEWKSQDRAV